MQLRSGKRKLDACRPTFDPHLDIATVVFSHVQCVKTRVNLARVSKLWRDASKPAAAYPRTFDFDAVPDIARLTHLIGLLDNDEALSLPYDRVVGLLGKAANRYNPDWSEVTSQLAAWNGHFPALQYLRQNGCPWGSDTCFYAAHNKHWDCLQYAVDNKCPGWEKYAEEYADHLR
jgi:hypothetical protein